MRARAFPERYAHLPWLIATMTVVALVTGVVAAQYIESRLLWKLAAAWVIVWLPLFVFALWSTARLKKQQTQAEQDRIHAATAEANYRQLVEQAKDIIYRVDLNGYFTYINPTVTRYKGYTQEELIGQHFTTHIRPDMREAAKRYYLRQFARKTPSTYYEFPVLTKEGREIWLGQNVQLLYENGQVIGFQAVARDITERKQAEEALAASEKRLRTILDAEPECVKVTTEDGILLDMNAAGLAMIEADSLEQVRGQSVCPLIEPSHRNAFAEFTRRVYQGEPGTMQFEIIGLKGTRRWMDTHAVPLRDEHNATIGVLAITHDITKRKQVEEKLLLSQEIIANTQDPISILDLQGRFLYQNASHASLVGFADDELLGRTPALFLGDDAFTNICRELGATQNYRGEVVARTKDGTSKTLELVVSGVKDARKNLACFVAIKRDVTERKRVEEALQKLVSELAESRNRFEMFFRQTPSAIAITTVKEGRFLDVNKQVEVLTGYSRDELVGRTTLEMNLYVDPTERTEVVQRIKEEGVLTDLERQIRNKSGEIRTAVFSLVPIQMGAEPCLLSIAHDITERKQAEQALNERSRQQAIGAELSLLAVTVQDLPALLNTAARLVSNALDVNYCEVLQALPRGTDMLLCASAGWRGDGIGRVKASEPGSLAHAALHADKPVVIQQLPGCAQPAGPPWLNEQGAVGAIGVAIQGKDEPWGVLSVYRAGRRSFSHDDVNFLQTVASVLATTIERTRAEAVLRSANDALKTLSRQLLQVQEEDRRTIARDLHDEIGQSLTAIKLNVERAQRTADRAARDKIMKDCVQVTEHVLGQVRDLSLDLHPSILDDLGLPYALKWYADRQAERSGLTIKVTADSFPPRLPRDVELACFRIAQEALTNVVRHAKASLVVVTLVRGMRRLALRVQDDGVGFVVDAGVPTGSGKASVGLTSMQERARLLGGEVMIRSAPGEGTEVIATLPLTASAEAPAPGAARS